ncbi:MAG: hypothetical protein IBJ18_05980 [Phycisphaerales bacterium]|nr:hypothetical protein [Phycisphaerales bacterium]
MVWRFTDTPLDVLHALGVFSEASDRRCRGFAELGVDEMPYFFELNATYVRQKEDNRGKSAFALHAHILMCEALQSIDVFGLTRFSSMRHSPKIMQMIVFVDRCKNRWDLHAEAHIADNTCEAL